MATRNAKRPRKKTAATKTMAQKRVLKKPAATPAKKTAKSPRRTKKAVPVKAASRKVVAKQAAPKKDAKRSSARSARSASNAHDFGIDPSLLPCSDDALRAATGKGWDEWLSLLDASGAATQPLDHGRLWDLVMQALPASAGWWGQMVSVGYERARGLREKHGTCSGDFQATISRTLPVPLFAAFASWADENLRRNWLDAPGLDFTKLNAGKNIRARWPGGALLDIRFNASAPDRCRIVVDTMKLPDADAVREAKAFWQSQFERLSAYLKP